MGFFSAIGGAISSAVSAVAGGIGSLGATVSGGIGALASSLLSPLSVTIPEVLVAVQVICAIVKTIGEALGLTKEDESMEEIGMKAEKADKSVEDFPTREEYIEYLREEVEIDPEEVKNLSDEDRAKYAAVGAAITIQGIEEKYDIEAPGEFWRTVSDRQLDGTEVQALIKNFKENGIKDMKDVDNYLNGKEVSSDVDRSQISGTIMDTMKELEPSLSDDEIADKFNALLKVED